MTDRVTLLRLAKSLIGQPDDSDCLAALAEAITEADDGSVCAALALLAGALSEARRKDASEPQLEQLDPPPELSPEAQEAMRRIEAEMRKAAEREYKRRVRHPGISHSVNEEGRPIFSKTPEGTPHPFDVDAHDSGDIWG